MYPDTHCSLSKFPLVRHRMWEGKNTLSKAEEERALAKHDSNSD